MPRNNPSEPWVPSSVEKNDAPIPHDEVVKSARESLYETGAADKGAEPVKAHWFQSGKNPNDELWYWIGTDDRIYGKGQKMPDGVKADGLVKLVVEKVGEEWYTRAFIIKRGETGLEDFAVADSGGDSLPFDPADPSSAPSRFTWQSRDLFAAKDIKTSVRRALVELQGNGKLHDPTRHMYQRPKVYKILPGLALAAVIVALALMSLFSDGQKAATPSSPPAPTQPSATRNADGSIGLGDRTYYVVYGNDKAKDTGDEVCASVSKTCVGYTDLTTSSCMATHPGAQVVSDFDGSKSGFWCNGAPQGGVCGREANTCHICPACNLNMDCAMEVGVLYAETYVECK